MVAQELDLNILPYKNYRPSEELLEILSVLGTFTTILIMKSLFNRGNIQPTEIEEANK